MTITKQVILITFFIFIQLFLLGPLFYYGEDFGHLFELIEPRWLAIALTLPGIVLYMVVGFSPMIVLPLILPKISKKEEE